MCVSACICVFGFVCGTAVWKPLVGVKIKHMSHVHMCIGMCAHMRMNLKGGGGGGSCGCQEHAIWAAGEGVAEVRSQN